MPSPAHVGHAPKGLLKEKERGESSSMEMPQSGQARFWEKSISLFARPDIRDDDAAGEGERRFQRIGQAGADILAQNQAIDDDLDVVLFLLGERGRFRRVVDFPRRCGRGQSPA